MGKDTRQAGHRNCFRMNKPSFPVGHGEKSGATYLVATSFCWLEDDDSWYPQANADRMRALREYLNCCIASAASCRLSNPNAAIVVAVNDRSILDHTYPGSLPYLDDLGVQLIEVPYRLFHPGISRPTRFRASNYKFEVLHHLCQNNRIPVVCIDNDSLVLRNLEPFMRSLSSERIYLYDVYQGLETGAAGRGLSRHTLGMEFRRIDPDFPAGDPIHLGGEFFAGQPDTLLQFTEQVYYTLQRFKGSGDDASIRMANDWSIVDGCEYLLSYVACRMSHDSWTPVPSCIIKRVWTTLSDRNATRADLSKHAILHLPAEKDNALQRIARGLLAGRIDDVTGIHNVLVRHALLSDSGFGAWLHAVGRTVKRRLAMQLRKEDPSSTHVKPE